MKDTEEKQLDDKVILNLIELGNGDGVFENRLLVVQLIHLYMENFDERILNLKQGVEHQDPKAIEMSAHALKSSSLLIGLTKLAQYCQELEDLGFSKNIEKSKVVWESMERLSQKTIPLLKQKIVELEK